MEHISTNLLSVVVMLAAMNMSVIVYAETVETRIGKLDFESGVTTKETVARLYDEMVFSGPASFTCGRYL